MSATNSFVGPQIYEYIISISVPPDAVLEDLRRETESMPLGRMQISADQGQLMSLLVRVTRATRAIEVGVFTGYSALCVARSLPSQGTLVACDISREYTDIARRYWKRAGVADKVDLRLAPAAETLAGLLDAGESGMYDIAFIDADKDNYPLYYERCLELLRPGGLMMVDNALWGGKVADPEAAGSSVEAIRGLNRFAADDERVDAALLAVGDGLLLAHKR